jgi:hypothetical protein
MVARERRFLVLGSEGYGRSVRSHGWNAIPEDLNVGDFDVVILDFVSAFDDAGRAEVGTGYLPSPEDFGHLLFRTPSTVVAIGHPRAYFVSQLGHQVVGRGVQWWLPCVLDVDDRAGERFELANGEWAFWFDHLSGYEWHFRGPRPISELHAAGPIIQVVPGGGQVLAQWEPVAATRAGSPIAVQLRLEAMTVQGHVLAENERVTWLPAVSELSPHESVSLILSHVFGVTGRGAAPSWSEAYRLPEEVRALQRVQAQERTVERATAELEKRRAKAADAGRLRALLHEHDEALEGLVYDALRKLGGVVRPPSRAGIEDGRLVDPSGREAMLEIKGNLGPLKVREVRQLYDWTRRAFFDEGWEGKGVIIANLKLDQPPVERTELYGSEALAAAERSGIAILTTSQLYEALRQNELSTLDSSAFWDEVLTASGPCSLPTVQPNS